MRAALLAAVLLTTRAAVAYCPATGVDVPTSYPKDGALGVALDASIVIPITRDAGAEWCWEGDWLSWPVWTLTVTPTGGSPVSGVAAYFDFPSHCAAVGRETFAFRPAAPLEPNTHYDVSFVYQDADPSWPSSFALTSSFTTGSAALPPLAFSGSLQVTTLVKTLKKEWCMQPSQCGGGGGCNSEPYQAVVAQLTGLQLSGGQEATGYDVAATLGVNAPVSSWQGWRPREHAAAGAKLAFELVLEDEGDAYSPCFVVFAWDAAGHSVTSQPVCLPALDPSALLPADAATDAPVPTDAGTDSAAAPDASAPARGSSPSGGCAVGHSSGHLAGGGWLAALALALGLRRRGVGVGLSCRRAEGTNPATAHPARGRCRPRARARSSPRIAAVDPRRSAATPARGREARCHDGARATAAVRAAAEK